MTDSQQEQPTRARGTLSLTACLFWLTLVMGGAFLLVGSYAHSQRGMDGLWASVVACLICWLAGAIALAIVRVAQAMDKSVNGLLGAMLVRLGLPMVVGLILDRRGGPLADAGVFGQIVIFYLVMLVTEAYLSVRLVKQATDKTKAS